MISAHHDAYLILILVMHILMMQPLGGRLGAKSYGTGGN